MAGEHLVHRGDRSFDAAQPERRLAPADPIAPPMRGSIRRVDLGDDRKLIALTFDLCERQGEIAGYDGAIIETLRREGVPATLFAGGKWLRSHEARAEQLLLDPLFEIANHGDTHRNLRRIDSLSIEREILGPQRTYETLRARLAKFQCVRGDGDADADAGTTAAGPGVMPRRMRLFRFPYGACHQASLDAVNDAGLLAIQWDVSTGDPVIGQSARKIADAMVSGARPGSIIIGHANGRGWNTAAALPIAIQRLKAMGFTFVTVSALLAAGTPVIAASCYNARVGDTDRYDRPMTAERVKPSGTKIKKSRRHVRLARRG